MSWASSTLPESVKNKAHNRNYSSLSSEKRLFHSQQRALVTSRLLNIPAPWPNHTSSPRGCPGKLPRSTAAHSCSQGWGSSWQSRDGKLLLHQLSPIYLYWNLLAAFQALLRNLCPSSDVSVDSQPALWKITVCFYF